MRRKSDSVFDLISPEDFIWRVRRVSNWLGASEFMIELEGIDGCVSFGDSITAAKLGLEEALELWIRHHGESLLPESCSGAQIILLEPQMSEEEVLYLNTELKKLT
ncbi:type II toxin-antitoxin system HicB family antitoxin [Bacillus solitudinis]|uniref:type II toxin-antitoxin system HicB family antitoxin n=1 Tax=Bacillus solitudinis TaxID=2014074 RepID=UPI000C24E7AC|nr:type II toxin-antitoxin system HicB family antitoxin [Bacillus solitudinis]